MPGLNNTPFSLFTEKNTVFGVLSGNYKHLLGGCCLDSYFLLFKGASLEEVKQRQNPGLEKMLRHILLKTHIWASA